MTADIKFNVFFNYQILCLNSRNCCIKLWPIFTTRNCWTLTLQFTMRRKSAHRIRICKMSHYVAHWRTNYCIQYYCIINPCNKTDFSQIICSNVFFGTLWTKSTRLHEYYKSDWKLTFEKIKYLGWEDFFTQGFLKDAI